MTEELDRMIDRSYTFNKSAKWPDDAAADLAAEPLGRACDLCGFPINVCSYASIEAGRRGLKMTNEVKDPLAMELLQAWRKIPDRE